MNEGDWIKQRKPCWIHETNRDSNENLCKFFGWINMVTCVELLPILLSELLGVYDAVSFDFFTCTASIHPSLKWIKYPAAGLTSFCADYVQNHSEVYLSSYFHVPGPIKNLIRIIILSLGIHLYNRNTHEILEKDIYKCRPIFKRFDKVPLPARHIKEKKSGAHINNLNHNSRNNLHDEDLVVIFQPFTANIWRVTHMCRIEVWFTELKSFNAAALFVEAVHAKAEHF